MSQITDLFNCVAQYTSASASLDLLHGRLGFPSLCLAQPDEGLHSLGSRDYRGELLATLSELLNTSDF